MTEREKMLAGEIYDATDPDLAAERLAGRRATARFSLEVDDPTRMAIIAELFGSFGSGSYVERPFFCDYGSNIYVGSETFVNTNAVFLECAAITIGDRVNMASGVQLLAADHPRDAAARARKEELAKPVTSPPAWSQPGTPAA